MDWDIEANLVFQLLYWSLKNGDQSLLVEVSVSQVLDLAGRLNNWNESDDEMDKMSSFSAQSDI